MAASSEPRTVRLRINRTGFIIIGIFMVSAAVASLVSWQIGILTLSINAVSESLELTLKQERTYAWRLPPGSYGLLSLADSKRPKRCIGTAPDIKCEIAESSTLRVSGGAFMTLEVLPSRQFVLGLIPLDDEMLVEVTDATGDVVAESADLVFFESKPGAPETRLPMILEKATLGSLLHESTGEIGPVDSIWQPMLVEGAYAVFASIGSKRSRFKFLDGNFDPGDVIEMRARAEGDNRDAAIWGHVAVAPNKDSQDLELLTTLHTPHAKLNVRRFGSPDGYTISTKPWQVISKLPFWQATWIIFVSLLLIYDVYCAGAERNKRWDSKLLAFLDTGPADGEEDEKAASS